VLVDARSVERIPAATTLWPPPWRIDTDDLMSYDGSEMTPGGYNFGDNRLQTGQVEDEGDFRGLNMELTMSHVSAVVVHHQLHPNEPLDSNEIVHDDMRAIAAHALVTVGRDPAVSEWLARPRSLMSRLIAFFLGCALVTCLYIWFGLPGVFGAGYLLGPLIAPGASLVLARRIFGWVHRVRLPKGGSDGLTVHNYFTTGLTLTVGTIFTATDSWLAHDGIHLAIPIIVLILVLVVTPLYYVVVKDAYNQPESHSSS
jgi:hypothetical protein